MYENIHIYIYTHMCIHTFIYVYIDRDVNDVPLESYSKGGTLDTSKPRQLQTSVLSP